MVASQDSVILKLTEPQFSELGQKFPDIWRAIAKELARRLEQRNALVTNARDKIRMFIISSTEGIEIVRAIQNAFAHDPFIVTPWTEGVFRASEYTIESLERILDDSDFAIAIAQPDDMTESRGTTSPTPRDNVIFELGMFIGRLGLKRTFETILMLSAEEVAGLRTPGKASGDIRCHGSQGGRVALADRQLKVKQTLPGLFCFWGGRLMPLSDDAS